MSVCSLGIPGPPSGGFLIEKRRNMKVLVLGAAGYEGKELARVFVHSDYVSHVILGDKRADKLQQIAAESGEKASARVIDVTDTEQLVNLMKEVDLVANAVGPYYRYLIPILKAAIEARVNYIDLCESTDAMLKALEFNEAAQNAGIMALLGVGDAPGLDNVVCKYAIDKLDRVEKIHIYWCNHWTAQKGGYASSLQLFYYSHGMNKQVLGGKEVDVPAGSGAELVDFPDGTLECRFVKEPEPITLARYANKTGKGPVKEAFNKGGISPQCVQDELIKVGELLGSDEPLYIKSDLTVVPRDIAIRIVTQRVGSLDLGEPWSGFKYEVIGQREGKHVRYVYTPTKGASILVKPMESLTAHCLTTAAAMFAEGQIKAKGVVTPEECINPESFLSRLMGDLGEQFLEETEIVTSTRLFGEVS